MKPLRALLVIFIIVFGCVAYVTLIQGIGPSTTGSESPGIATPFSLASPTPMTSNGAPPGMSPSITPPPGGDASVPIQATINATSAAVPGGPAPVGGAATSQLPNTGKWGLPLEPQRLLPVFVSAGAGTLPQDVPVFGRIQIFGKVFSVDSPVLAISSQNGLTPNGELRQIWEIPDYAAGYHVGSALPGQVGNVVISGHNNIGSQVFQQLEESQPGDTIYLTMSDGAQYVYTVRKVMIVSEDGQPDAVRLANARHIGPTNDMRLTLVSCWPDWSNTQRVIVVAQP